ncbi:MAG: hypothetical protein INR72_17730 [Williamsia herbipolensis]|nr:hypothetical protein [Williamsia herbipolensis]
MITTDTAVDKIVTQTDKAPDGSWTTSVTNPTGDGQIVATVHTTTSDGRVIDTDVWYDGTRQSHENDAFTQGHAVTKEMGAGDSYLRISDKAPDGTRSTTEVVGSQTTIDTFRPDKSSTHIDMVSAEEFTRIDTDPDGNWVNFHREPGQPDIRTTYTKATGAVVPVTLPEKIGTIRQASTIDTGAGPDPLVDGVRPVTAAAVPTVAVTASFLEVPTALGGPGTQEAPAPAPSAFAPFAAPAGGTAPGVPTLPSAAGLAHAPQQAMDLAMQQLDRPLAGAQHAADQAIGTVTDLPGTAQKTVDGLTHDAQKTVDGLTTTVTDLPGQAQKTVTDLTTTVTDLPGQAQKTVDGFAHQIDVFGRQASNTITEASDLLSHPGHLIDRGEQAAEHALDRFDVNDAATAGRTALDQLVGTETYRAAFDEYLGWRGSIEGSTTVGGVTLAGGMSASLGLGASGSLTATVGPGGVAAAVAAHAYIGADGEAHGMIDAGLVGAGGAVQAHAGAVADVNARGSAGLDGAKADVGLSAWTGADAGGSAKADLGVATGSAGGHVGTGLGVKLNAGADLSFDKIGVRFDVGAALGIGAEWSADLSVNPSKIVTGVAEIITHPADDLKAIGGAASDVGDFALHAGDTIGSGLGDAAEWTAHAVGDVGDAVIDGGGEVLHTVGKVLPWNW